MPRISPENRAAAIFRSGAKWPSPPRGLGRRPAQIWRTIIRDRDPGFYRGHETQLAHFCRCEYQRERVTEALERAEPGSATAVRLSAQLRTMNSIVIAIARTLRLNLNSRKRLEAGELNEISNGAIGHALIGGSAVNH